MKFIVKEEPVVQDISSILNKLRKADELFLHQEQLVRKRCLELVKRVKEHAKKRELKLFTEMMAQVETWKLGLEQKCDKQIRVLVTEMLRTFLQNNSDAQIEHLVHEIRDKLFCHSVSAVNKIRVTPELVDRVYNEFSGIAVVADACLDQGMVVIETPDGEMAYSYRRHLELLLETL